jgi:glycerate 2-kinase
VKIVVALDKFKGSLTASCACDVVRDALLSIRPELRVVTKPMADGGDGTDDVLLTALDGEWITAPVIGPLPEISCTARYAWLPKEATAVIAMANASGLALLKPERRNPLLTTTYGTGELIHAAVKRGAKRIWLAAGGSASVDGGVGAAMALGWRFLDAQGKPVGFGGAELERIARIERPDKLLIPAVEVLCDVDNPLCGNHGAARIFGPQKSATPTMVEQLDAGLQHLGRLVKEQLGKDIVNVPGAGAAGGLGGGALAFMDARLSPGIDTVIHATGMDAELADANWVITGEGRFDEQSLHGKVVSGVAKLAAKHGVKIAVLAGSVQISEKIYRREGIEFALSTMKPGMELNKAIEHAKELLASAARELATLILS